MSRLLRPEDLLTIRLAGDAQISPDGGRVAFVVTRIDKEQNEYRHQIYMVETRAGALPSPFTNGPKSDRQPRWSPDGSRLAFLSNRSGKNQIWLIDTLGGEARQLTRFKDGVACAPFWSPDGKRIAFTAFVDASGYKSDAAKDDDTDLFKKFTKDVKRINRIHYKLDGEGFLEPDKHEHLFTIAVDSDQPEPQQLTRGPWNHQSPAWAPDGRSIAFTANRRPDDDYTPYLSDLWVQSTEPGAEPVRLTPDGFAAGKPSWSPDGSRIAFSGHLYQPFQSYSSDRLWVVDRDGANLRRVEQNWDRTFANVTVYDTPGATGNRIVWTPDGGALITLGADAGRQQVYRIELASGQVTPLTNGDHCVTSWSVDRAAAKVAVSLTRPDVPGDIFLGDGVRLSNLNEELFAEVKLAPVEHFRFAAGGGTNAFVQEHGEAETDLDAWVMLPAIRGEGKRFPAILQVHGGPMAMYGFAFMMEFQCLAAAGYGVIYTNPRGSQGYSERFCACIKEDWGNLDYLDVMAGLEAALKRCTWIDPDRVGIAGGSYGGYMVNWAVSHSDRFKAAITMRSCVNEFSMVGTSDFGFVDMATYPSRPWNDMSFYRRFSPITFVEQIHTPLLIEHQENDLRCPIGQAEELYSALKSLRRTVEFVRYPDSSHGMSRDGKPWLRVHRLQTIVEWFDQYIER